MHVIEQRASFHFAYLALKKITDSQRLQQLTEMEIKDFLYPVLFVLLAGFMGISALLAMKSGQLPSARGGTIKKQANPTESGRELLIQESEMDRPRAE